jgi:hypothetical protein
MSPRDHERKAIRGTEVATRRKKQQHNVPDKGLIIKAE